MTSGHHLSFLTYFLKNLHLWETLIMSASQNDPGYLDMVMKPKIVHKHCRVSYILYTCILFFLLLYRAS